MDIANELFAMAATISRIQAMRRSGHPNAREAAELADLFCRQARRKIKRLFADLRSNDDVRKYKVAQGVLSGRQLWLEALLEGLEQESDTAEEAAPADCRPPGRRPPIRRPQAVAR